MLSTSPNSRTPRTAAQVAAVGALVAALASTVAAGHASSAELTDPSACVVERDGTRAVVSWADIGGTNVLRRDGAWLATPGAGTSSYADDPSPPGASYVLRTWLDGVQNDRPCTTVGDATGGSGCTISRDHDRVTVRWVDDGGIHVIRRDGDWLATPGAGTDRFVDEAAPAGASYALRTWLGADVLDRPCTIAAGPTPPPTPTSPPPSAGHAERVIHVSIDGLRADHVTPALMPNLTRLIRAGASTLNARTDPAFTQTLPNHHSQFTGRAVGGSGGHGVDDNTDRGRTVHQEAGSYVASVFDIVHDRGGATALFAGKPKFDMMHRNWSANGAPDRVGADDGRDKIDVYANVAPATAVGRLADVLRQRRSLQYAFFHIRNPDSAGHDHDWGSSHYRAAVRDADEILGDVLSLIEADPALAATTAVIVVADHGGPTGFDLHSDASKPGSYTIPFVVWGAGVAAGADLYALNRDDRAEPGTARVWLDGRQPIRGHDVANLALDLLGYPPVPGSTFNVAQDLDVR